MNRPPFASLKLSLSLVLAAVLLASGATLWSRSQSHDAETRLQQQNSALNAAQQQLDRSQQQQHLIATHLAAYQALVARGFVGAEDRLAWIEAAQHANRDAGLYGLNYHLAPRRRVAPGARPGLAAGTNDHDAHHAIAGGNRSPALSGGAQSTGTGCLSCPGLPSVASERCSIQRHQHAPAAGRM